VDPAIKAAMEKPHDFGSDLTVWLFRCQTAYATSPAIAIKKATTAIRNHAVDFSCAYNPARLMVTAVPTIINKAAILHASCQDSAVDIGIPLPR
jgi:hypothetical protein